MKNPKSLKSIARRNLHIIAAYSAFLAILIWFISAKAWFKWSPTPDYATVEMLRADDKALSAAMFVAMPLLGLWLLASAIVIWIELRRLRKSESEVSDSEIVNRKS